MSQMVATTLIDTFNYSLRIFISLRCKVKRNLARQRSNGDLVKCYRVQPQFLPRVADLRVDNTIAVPWSYIIVARLMGTPKVESMQPVYLLCGLFYALITASRNMHFDLAWRRKRSRIIRNLHGQFI